MTYSISAKSTVFCVTTAELADHLRLVEPADESSVDSAALQRSIEGATSAIETAYGLSLLPQVVDWSFRRWPEPDFVPLPIGPLLNGNQFELVAADGTRTLIPSAEWRVDRSRARDGLRAVSGAFPEIPPGGNSRVLFQPAFGSSPEEVPADLRQAVLLLAGHFFERRFAAEELAMAPLPHGVAALLEPYRPTRL